MKRLKALIELEKASSHRKHDCQAAQLAVQRRHAANSKKKRSEIKEKIADREEARVKVKEKSITSSLLPPLTQIWSYRSTDWSGRLPKKVSRGNSVMIEKAKCRDYQYS